MKKFFSIAALVGGMMLLWGCPEKPDDPEVKDSISIDPKTYTAACTGDSFTPTVTASSSFTAEPSVNWLTVSGATITVAENTTYEPRTGKVTFKCGTATAEVTVTQEAAPKPKEYTELAGPANSYLVSAAGDYKIKATVMGNGDAGLHESFPITSTAINPAGATLVWEEFEGLITDVKLQDGFLCFTCANKDGNAVVAATAADGTILWSWHIWSAEAPQEVNCGTWVLMDRNLGATMASGDEADGLFFEWGRKDPFSAVLAFDSAAGEGWYHPVVGGGDDETSADIHCIAYSVAHPIEYIAKSNRNCDWLIEANQRYLWGINWEVDGNIDFQPFKSVYDPCPKGYAVATPNCLAAGLNEASKNSDNSITLFGGKILVPAAGFIYNGGYGWYDADGAGWAGLWTCSTSWGNTENAFRLRSTDDARDNYDRATGHPVRCQKFAE